MHRLPDDGGKEIALYDVPFADNNNAVKPTDNQSVPINWSSIFGHASF